MKLCPMDQLLMTLMKLRLNSKMVDLSFHFGVSPMTASRYVTTWICFLYHHLKEVNWMPSVAQVAGTLPPALREQFPNTYAIIDASEVFLEIIRPSYAILNLEQLQTSQYGQVFEASKGVRSLCI